MGVVCDEWLIAGECNDSQSRGESGVYNISRLCIVSREWCGVEKGCVAC